MKTWAVGPSFLPWCISILADDIWVGSVLLARLSWLECDMDNKFGLYQIAGYETTQIHFLASQQIWYSSIDNYIDSVSFLLLPPSCSLQPIFTYCRIKPVEKDIKIQGSEYHTWSGSWYGLDNLFLRDKIFQLNLFSWLSSNIGVRIF